ncbi:enhancer of mRNA decapping [Malassezia cuniculi]|uniref:Enhancer of mRNA decapping n=1 Tax=Malassezia cuniculi TaxID=948313 RepID=A0AAF0EPK4_9BASI|nr:enhancer of mRNA decapping [Malassezia cuniculi]
MPAFVGHAHGPVLTLLFADAATQHKALARIEAFYESSTCGTYLTCEQAVNERVCKGYEAFNFPVDALSRWLDALKVAAPPVEEDEPWWKGACTEEECEFIQYVYDTSVLNECRYIISSLIAQADTSLAHERLHALYALSERYKRLVHSLWDDLPKPAAAAISFDLKMRGYAEAVWPDEFGAYLGVRVPTTRRTEPTLEFGNKNAEACRDARRQLLAEIPTCWKEDVGVEESVFAVSPAQLEEARAAIPRKPKAPTNILPKKGTKKRR